MRSKTQTMDTAAVASDDRNTTDVVNALFVTLETMLPHAARQVEEKAQILVDNITALVRAAQAQEANIGQLIACVQQARIADHAVPLQEHLKRLQVTLAFSLEHNLSAQYSATQWQTELDSQAGQVDALIRELLQVAAQQPALARSLTALRQVAERIGEQLRGLRAEMKGEAMQPRERGLFEKDMRMIGELLAAEPARARQLQALLQDINANARQIVDTGRAAIMTIQFQDYNTQMTENALKLLRVLREHVTATEDGEQPCGEVLYSACYQALTLGEVRRIFADNFSLQPDSQAIESGSNHIEFF